jgi:hypothetical protein
MMRQMDEMMLHIRLVMVCLLRQGGERVEYTYI